ncbi:MAG: family transcriptional regulator, cyclic receptor protein [Alphaproteobacteria bacterium]|nr:family transcriptional regulator, cyclic receptor protein [Alphaproteobacteria bacterium]
MQVFAAAWDVPERLNLPGIETGSGRSLLLTENVRAISGAPSLFNTLSPSERETLVRWGRRRVLYRGQTLFSQGARHDGIFLIETGRIRVYYTAPSQREITLAYWHPGNFVGGPEVFGEGVHQWSGVASSNSSVVHLPGKELRKLVGQIPNLAIGLIEGLTFKGKCYSALAQMLGTRSITERLAHLLLHLVELYGMEDPDGILIGAAFTHADLAHMVGATRQWVSISLKRLQEKNVLVVRKSKIIVRRSDILREMQGRTVDLPKQAALFDKGCARTGQHGFEGN